MCYSVRFRGAFSPNRFVGRAAVAFGIYLLTAELYILNLCMPPAQGTFFARHAYLPFLSFIISMVALLVAGKRSAWPALLASAVACLFVAVVLLVPIQVPAVAVMIAVSGPLIGWNAVIYWFEPMPHP